MANEVLAPGSVFAGYTIVRALGSGGMGAVYVAKHPHLPRLVALKVLHRNLTSDAYVRSRFELEAEHAARLDHPNIVTVYDRGREDDQLWIAMKYVEGTDAGVQLKSGPFPVARALHVLTETGRALDYAHTFRILHRDVKPANILLSPGPPGSWERVWLTDFGIAKAIDETTHLTQTGMLVATLLYASPEQLEGKPLDARADVYALACTFFHLVSGSPPYRGGTAASIIYGHLNQPIPSISQACPGLPPQLDAVMARGLAKDRDQRFGSCAALSDAVRQVLYASAHTAPAMTPPPGSMAPPTQQRTLPPIPASVTPPPMYMTPPPISVTPRPVTPPPMYLTPPPAAAVSGPRPAPAPARKSSRRGLIGTVAVVLLLAAAAVAGFVLWPKSSTTASPEILAFSGLSGPTGLAVDGAGNTFVVDANNRRVLKLAGGTQSELPFGGLSAPSGLAEHEGTVYVTDPLAKKVWQLWAGDPAPKELPFTLQEPVGVAVSSEGDIFVSDYVGKTVWVAYAQSEDLAELNLDDLSSPHGLAVHGSTVYIVDTNTNRVIAFDMQKGTQEFVPFSGLVSPHSIAVNAQGDIYVTDSSVENRVAKLEAATGKQTAIPLEGLTFAQGIAVDSSGAVYVSDLNRNRVIKLPER